MSGVKITKKKLVIKKKVMKKNICVEYVNKEVCDKLSLLTFSQYINLVGDKEITNKSKKQDTDKVKNQYAMMKRYCRLQIKNNYKITREYFATNREYGRVYAEGDSLQRLNKKIRGALGNDIYYDYDMSNAQPTILKNLCEEKGINCSNLDRYVKYRNEVFEELQDQMGATKDEIKNLIITCIFSEKVLTVFNKKKIKAYYFIELQKEIKNIQNKIFNNPEYQDTLKVLKKRGSNNIKGRLLSYVLSKIENDILEYVGEKFSHNVKIFDGFLSKYKYDIKDINEYCKNKYNITWTEKQLDTDILETLEDLDVSNNPMSYCGESVLDISLFLLKNKFTKLFICNNELYYHNGNIWFNKKDEIKRLIKCEISNCDLYREVGDEFVCVNDNVKGVNDTYEFIFNHTPIEDNLLDNIWDNTVKKLFFKNGYYDFSDCTFKQDNRDTLIYIKRDLNMESNKSVRKEIFDRVLNPIFNGKEETLKSWLYEMAQTIAGNYERKTWYTLEGLRNCGKGILSDFLINSFQSYIQITNSDNFLYKESSADSAKANSWLCDFSFSRMVITQEIGLKDGSKTFLDGNKIKKFCSGGDRIECRKNFQDEQRIRLQCSLMLCCNDLPERKPNDCNEFLKHYIFTSKFVGEDEEQLLGDINYYKKDETLKSQFLNRKDVQNEFILILLEHYNQKVILPKQQEDIEEENDFKRLFDLFDFTGSLHDRIDNKELFSYVIDEKKCPFSKNKITRLLKGKGASPVLKNNSRGLGGLRFKKDTFLDDSDNDDY